MWRISGVPVLVLYYTEVLDNYCAINVQEIYCEHLYSIATKKTHDIPRQDLDDHMEHRLPALRQSIDTYPLTSKLAL
jgi:hypothetical protein